MRSRRTILISMGLLLLAGAWLFWHAGARRAAENNPARTITSAVRSSSTAPQILFPKTVSANPAQIVTAAAKTNRFAYRLVNTTKSIGELVNDRRAILLENALIDTRAKLDFSIPKNLQSPGDPGAYIVQADGPVSAAFRAMLAAAGAQIVSYIPNNAYLVRISAGGANSLAANPLAQSVIPYEPYYKVQSPLLAFDEKVLPAGAVLNLGLFADDAAATVRQIENLGGKILSRDSSPFGPVVRVQPPENWTALAQLPGVQIVEPAHERVHANDLSRVTTGLSLTSVTTSNYMNLSGSNVVVEVNDSGIDTNHPDLQGRVLFNNPANGVDTDGHGTFVAGQIAGDGTKSTTVTNAQGSINPGTNFQYRGKAPLAKLFAMNLNSSDQTLQQAAAQTNALISNNSWGYGGDNEYDLAAAGYDAATRDALAGATGSQPVLFVFAAGNDGYNGANGMNGDNDGGGGDADTISSPGTAKNVITVGALEQLRNITNKVTDASGNTNTQPWLKMTDTSYQVADYSSRGNVGIGVEGTFGRYKPDVVAPGSFVISTRSSEWDQNAYDNPTNDHDTTLTDVVSPGSLTDPPLQFFVYNNAVDVKFTADDISATNDLPIFAWPGTNPNSAPPILEGTNSVTVAIPAGTANRNWFAAVSNVTTAPLIYSLTADVQTTNDLGNYYQVLSNLNNTLGSGGPGFPNGYYRYESGTSMAAADVSGLLALMQDYFLNHSTYTNPSPALLKAMVINGARSTFTYNFQVQNSINPEGWGLVNLPDSLPPGFTNQTNAACSTFFVDQNPTNALATGDSRTFSIAVSPAATGLPLRVTLAWTDPPGNPAAAIKLVNNLDLIVTNVGATNVYFGNDIPAGSVVNSVWDTNFPPNQDSINNVENVFLPSTPGTNFTITVVGRDVNVNAVSAQTNNAANIYAPNIVQDYALVVSCGEGEVTNALTVTDEGIVSNPTGDQQITVVVTTNAPLMNQFVGANSPLLGTNTVGFSANTNYGAGAMVTAGMTNQWHFYIVTNNALNSSGTGNSGVTNAAFITFSPDTLSIPRIGVYADSDANSTRPEADIDLYVTTDSGLTNLNTLTISNCVNGTQIGASANSIFNGASLGRGGTEFVVDTNSTPGQVYYVGVKSEDQMASEYGFLPVFSSLPFSQTDTNGNETVNGIPLPVVIPDGGNAHPGVASIFALALDPTITVDNVIVSNTVDSDNFGDLVGTLTHPGYDGAAILNNHDSPDPSGINTYTYDDSGETNIPGSVPTDGPGSLQSFAGQSAIGPWILSEVDDAPSQNAAVTGFTLLIKPHQPLGNGVTNTLAPGQWFYDFIDVPAGATNLTVTLTNLTASPQPLQLFIKLGAQPTLAVFDKMATINSGSPLQNGSITVGLTDVPPLQPGRYYIGVYNPVANAASQTFSLFATILPKSPVATPVDFASGGTLPLLDDAVMDSSISVTNTEAVVSVNVGIRVDHPRISDLVFHLISPDGTRVLLMENRGGNTANAGATYVVTNVFSGSASGGPAGATNFYDLHETSGIIPITWNFFQVPDQMDVYYQSNLIFSTGLVSYQGSTNISFGPGTSTKIEVVMDATYHPPSTFWTYTVGGVQTNYAYLAFTDDTNLTTTPIKYALPPFVPAAPAGSVWSDSFETYTPVPQTYVQGGGGFGWTVLTNSVSILTNPPAYDGTNFLSLLSGAVSTNLPTVSGKKYTLQYAQGALPITDFFVPNQSDGTIGQIGLNGNGSIFANDLTSPAAVAFDGSGNLYVADANNFASGAGVIYKFTLNGQQSVFANNLFYPDALAFDTNGNLYVADFATGNGDGTVQEFTPSGANGTFFAGGLNGPSALAFDSSNNLYVANYYDNTVEKFTPPGTNGTIYLTAGNGLNNPQALAFDGSGHLFVANASSGTVLEFTPPGINATTVANLGNPIGIAFDTSGNLFVADQGVPDIDEFTNGAAGFSFDKVFATDVNADLNSPVGLAYYSNNRNTENTNTANWQSESLTFTASQNNMPLVLDASGGGFAANSVLTNSFSAETVLDDFSLTEIASDLYYLPEQPLSTLNGISASGTWQLEIQDDRAGDTNNATLVSWELQIVLDNTNAVPATLAGGQAQTNFVAPGGIAWYLVTVPATANYSTNFLLFASAPVNFLYSTNAPPTTMSSGDVDFSPNSTGFTKLLSTTGAANLQPPPNIVDGATYYLGVQNTNSSTVNYGIKVNFDVTGQFSSLKFTSALRKSASSLQLQWTAPAGAQVEVQWADSLSSPMQWNTITNPAASTSNGVSTFTDNGSQTAPLGAHRYYRLVQMPEVSAPHQVRR
jgi:subtilisin-like proprotein convertase family protein